MKSLVVMTAEMPHGVVGPGLRLIPDAGAGVGVGAAMNAGTSATIWQAAVPLVIQAVKKVGPWIPVLYPEKIGEGSDQVPVPLPIPLPPNLPPPSSDDNEGQALYRRAKEGDRAALVRYAQREAKKLEYRRPHDFGVKFPKIIDGMKLSTDDSLRLAEQFLGEGYKSAGNGRYVSQDGLRQVRMGDNDILGNHGGAKHMNFETLKNNPQKPDKMQIIENKHVYLID